MDHTTEEYAMVADANQKWEDGLEDFVALVPGVATAREDIDNEYSNQL